MTQIGHVHGYVIIQRTSQALLSNSMFFPLIADFVTGIFVQQAFSVFLLEYSLRNTQRIVFHNIITKTLMVDSLKRKLYCISLYDSNKNLKYRI